MSILHMECEQNCASCGCRNKCLLANPIKGMCSKNNKCYTCEYRTKSECEVD